MRTKFHITLATALTGAALVLGIAAPASFSAPASGQPNFPTAVPSQPGEITGTDSATQAARAQERYLTSYGDSKPISQQPPAAGGGIDWAVIGITLGATCILVGALFALVARLRRRTHRVGVTA